MKHDPLTIANALAATTAVVFVACRILVGLFPAAAYSVARSWFHGIQFGRGDMWSLTAPSFVLGLVSSIVTAWLIGYLFAIVYQSVAKK